MTHISEFDYNLPKELIAQHPVEPRENARLMHVDRNTQTFSHHTVWDLPTFFKAGDVVVLNNTKVFKARLTAYINAAGVSDAGKHIEVFLVKPLSPTNMTFTTPTTTSSWLCLAKPARKLTIGSTITVAEDFKGNVIAKEKDGSIVIEFQLTAEEVIRKANLYGSIPLPPYIKAEAKEEEYQTSYAKEVGSVAAPTAGFHLTEHIRNKMSDTGVIFTEITLHVGMGTFMPVKTEHIQDHTMHSEWVHISEESSNVINAAKREGRRVIAIGTTVVRTLEGTHLHLKGGKELTATSEVDPFSGDVNLYITPGFKFKIVDGLLTNFHLPKSTLIMLVSAFAGKDLTFNAYREAVNERYRFFSFGDCMLII